jgi:hypothetical protein
MPCNSGFGPGLPCDFLRGCETANLAQLRDNSECSNATRGFTFFSNVLAACCR